MRKDNSCYTEPEISGKEPDPDSALRVGWLALSSRRERLTHLMECRVLRLQAPIRIMVSVAANHFCALG